MKKFSWIFALILALSMAFIACPSSDDDSSSTTPPPATGPGGGSGGMFGSGAGQVEVKKDGANAGNPIDPGTLTYLSDGSGFTYTYGTAANTNYGNSILRFKIDLGDDTLGSIGYVTFDWQAAGPYKTDVNTSKKLWLLASADEADLTPYKDSDKESDDPESIRYSIVSSTYFDENTGKKLWDDTTAPSINGIEKVTIQLPILKKTPVGGEVWFAIYVHASGGSYTISNFKLGGDPSYVNPGPGTEAPDEPLGGGDSAVDIDVDLTANTYTTPPSANINSTLPAMTFADGKLTAKFTENNQRINFKLTDDQVASLEDRDTQKIRVTIKGKFVSGDNHNFRYHIGTAEDGNGWNATSGSGDNQFGNILITEQTFDATNAPKEGRLKYFILQNRAAAEVTIEITSINIKTIPVDPDVAAPAFFTGATAKSATPTKKVGGNDVPDYDNYFGVYYGSGAGYHFIQGNIITVRGDGGFSLPLPEGFVVANTVKVDYACYLTYGTEAKFIKKQKDGFTNTTDPSLYPSFVTDAVGTITVTGFDADGVAANRVFFQANGSAFEAKIKIISITIDGADQKISTAVPGLRPVKDEVPVTTVTTDQYTGTVAWDPDDATFAAETDYTATITLTKKTGYTFNLIAANTLAVTGAKTVTHAAGTTGDTLVITATFDKIPAVAFIGTVWELDAAFITAVSGESNKWWESFPLEYNDYGKRNDVVADATAVTVTTPARASGYLGFDFYLSDKVNPNNAAFKGLDLDWTEAKVKITVEGAIVGTPVSGEVVTIEASASPYSKLVGLTTEGALQDGTLAGTENETFSFVMEIPQDFTLAANKVLRIHTDKSATFSAFTITKLKVEITGYW